ncbi:MAG: 4-hydroxy-3-methylbut-2-enyl diphosphate reductase [Bacteroidales bacterium]|nr:4-hydroxy-3-methylbut-2-enyl diphosphate reductase [Bacteroidales bacterium]MBQ7819774.1 4-hydroxy-3-methylbut-2-enyl diphosphate reductase [Bacteroidales bacterium]
MPIVEIDTKSGFCFGVVTAIKKAEEELEKGNILYCLGDIVHNNEEVERLKQKGLVTINHEEFKQLKNTKVLLRAHGEPPETYRIAEENNIEIIDATCPVVLRLQQQIKEAYTKGDREKEEIVIYGKRGHAEVNGLVGQTEGKAIVIEGSEDWALVDTTKKIHLYSQTTKSVEGLNKMAEGLRRLQGTDNNLEYHDTICRQVANRIPNIREFAIKHDMILFVCGEKSSNGKVLFEECKKVNPETQMISNVSMIDTSKLSGKKNIGICGATSTPKWLMEEVAEFVKSIIE